jgi:hypothetical protein
MGTLIQSETINGNVTFKVAYQQGRLRCWPTLSQKHAKPPIARCRRPSGRAAALDLAQAERRVPANHNAGSRR